MTQPISRKLKAAVLTFAGTAFQWQLKDYQVLNNTEDGERFYVYGDGSAAAEFFEDAEPDYALQLVFFSDWRLNDISDYLWDNDQLTVAYQIDHHPELAGEKIRLTGTLKIKAPNVGGEVRTTEMTEITLPVIGKPTKTRL